MRKITGTVTCSDPTRTIPPNSVIEVKVIDCSLACGKSLTCGKQEIRNVESFPFSFDFEYNDGKIDERYIGIYNLAVTIHTDEKLSFTDNVNFELKDHETGKIKDSIDVFVIPV